MAFDQISLATLPITEYSGSIPLEKKKDRLGANSLISIPLETIILNIGKSIGQGKCQLGDRDWLRLQQYGIPK